MSFIDTRTRRFAAALLLLLLCPPTCVAAADDPCAGFSWNVQHERALFDASAQSLSAAGTATAAPAVKTDRLYELKLLPQAQVSFAVPPRRQPRVPQPFAGLLQLSLTQGGLYRIALNEAAWIDVLADQSAIPSQDYQGRPGCQRPHKIVAFVLPAGKSLLVQVSGNADAVLRLSITRAAAAP
jgi:hypothetical protein